MIRIKEITPYLLMPKRRRCVKYLGDKEAYRVYCDDGKSGKDIEHRPAFQQMMSDAKDGLIEKIIVKKYDRFSRNMREYLNVTNMLDGYGVGVISLSEPFNTSTKEGRMMRNNLLNFAEFERETIAARVADAYVTRAVETGFIKAARNIMVLNRKGVQLTVKQARCLFHPTKQIL